MGNKKYSYSKKRALYEAAVIILGILIWVCLWIYISKNPSPSGKFLWIIVAIGVLRMIWDTSMLFHKLFLPLLRTDTALELSDDKLQFLDHLIAWKDIKAINKNSPIIAGSFNVMVDLIESNDTIFLEVKYIEGDSKDIYNTIIEYFEKYS